MTRNILQFFSLHSFTYLLTFISLLSLAYLSSCFGSLVSLIGRLIVLSMLSWLLTKKVRKHLNNEFITSHKKAILITGCDSGFGNDLALKLNDKGFRVYATVLDPESTGAQKLRTESRFEDKLRVIRMDVTIDEEVNEVFDQISKDLKQNEEQLWSVVNNAGILSLGPIDWGDIECYRTVFEVNTLGTVRVTRTFLPLLRQSKGRVVNIASMAGRITVPFYSNYSMSKHAVISFSDALRRETKRWGITVSTIEPTFFKTSMATQSNINGIFDKQWTETPEHIQQLYGKKFVDRLKSMQNIILVGHIELVIDTIVDAVRDTEPEIRYAVIPGPLPHRFLYCLLQLLPSEVFDSVLAYYMHR